MKQMMKKWMLRVCGMAAAMVMILSAACAQGQIVTLPVDDSAGPEVNPAYYLDESHYEDPSIQVSIEKHPWEKPCAT